MWYNPDTGSSTGSFEVAVVHVQLRGWREDRGSALLTVVGLLTVLTIAVTGILFVTQSNARLLKKKTDSMRAFYLAEAGLAVGESALLAAYGAAEDWITDETVQGENARVITTPLASLQEIEPLLSDLEVLVEVVDEAGVYRIRSSATISSGLSFARAPLVKYVTIQPGAGGGSGGVSQDFLDALSESALSGGVLDLGNNVYIQGTVHSNGVVEVGNNVFITLGYTDGDDTLMVVPIITDVAEYAEDQAEAIRAEYEGEWTSNPDDLVGNVYLQQDLSVDSNAVVDANLWVEGDLAVGSNTVINGDVFVEGDLTLGNGAEINGQVFVEGSLTLGNNVTIEGPVVVYGNPEDAFVVSFGNNTDIYSHLIATTDVYIGNNAELWGSVVSSQGSVYIGNNVVVGAPDYGALVYAAVDVHIGENATVWVGTFIVHGTTRIDNNGEILQSDLGLDTTVFVLFPSGGAGIIDSHWGG